MDYVSKHALSLKFIVMIIRVAFVKMDGKETPKENAK
jgi:hypothetical protein